MVCALGLPMRTVTTNEEEEGEEEKDEVDEDA